MKLKSASNPATGVSYKTAVLTGALTVCASGGILWFARQAGPEPGYAQTTQSDTESAHPVGGAAAPKRDVLLLAPRDPRQVQPSTDTPAEQAETAEQTAEQTDTPASETPAGLSNPQADADARQDGSIDPDKLRQAIEDALTPDSDSPFGDDTTVGTDPGIAGGIDVPDAPPPTTSDNDAGPGRTGSTVVGGSSGGGGGGGGSSIGGSSSGGGGGSSGGGAASPASAEPPSPGFSSGGAPPAPDDNLADVEEQTIDADDLIAADPDLVARIDTALMAQLKAGGAVHLPAGEHVIAAVDIPVPITLTADPDARLILAVGNDDPYGLRLQGDGSSIDGLAIDRGPGRAALTVQANDVTLERCTITGDPGTTGMTHGYGVYIRQSSERIRVLENTITDGGIGILASRFLEDVVIAHNTIEDIQGQHGIYVGQFDGMLIEGNTIKNCHYNGIKSQIDHFANTDSTGLRVVANRVEGTGNNAIQITRTSVASDGEHRDSVVRNNVVIDSEGNGLRMVFIDGVLIRGNRYEGVTRAERFSFVENVSR